MKSANDFREQYFNYPSDYLLELRAKGNLLVPEAQLAIEQLLKERGEVLPPIPSRPILPKHLEAQPGGAKNSFERTFRVIGKMLLVLLVGSIGGVIGKSLGGTWFGLVMAISIGIYLFSKWVTEKPEKQQVDDEERKKRKMAEEGLNELMVSASDGDMGRLKELLSYGADVNATSFKGVTALMLAARNNHVSIVEYLLTMDANPNLKTDSGKTALDIAHTFKHTEVISALTKTNPTA